MGTSTGTAITRQAKHGSHHDQRGPAKAGPHSKTDGRSYGDGPEYAIQAVVTFFTGEKWSNFMIDKWLGLAPGHDSKKKLREANVELYKKYILALARMKRATVLTENLR